MPPKKSTLTSGNKLLKLFRKLISDSKKHFLSDLAEELECSAQTIIRMIGEIKDEFGPHLEQGFDKKKRWYRYKTFNANNLGLDIEEVRYLSICRDLADPYLPDDIKDRVDKRILSLSIEIMGEKTSYKDGVGKLLEPTYNFFTKGHIDYSNAKFILEQIESSLRNSMIIQIQYYSVHSQKDKEILFRPVRFVCNNSAIYIVGFRICENLKDYENKPISLAIHRIIQIKKTNTQIDINLKESDIEDFGLPWEKEVYAFQIHFNAGRVTDYIKERTWAKDQIIKENPDGSLELYIKTKSIYEVYAWCRSFGDQILSVKQNGTLITDLPSRHF